MTTKKKTNWFDVLFPVIVWIVVGLVIIAISVSLRPDVCVITEENHDPVFGSIDTERTECLKAFNDLTFMFAVGAFIIGGFIAFIKYKWQV